MGYAVKNFCGCTVKWFGSTENKGIPAIGGQVALNDKSIFGFWFVIQSVMMNRKNLGIRRFQFYRSD